MSIDDPEISCKLVNIIKPSETLSSRIQNAATETRPEAVSLEIRTAMTPIRPSPPSVKAVLTEFAATASTLLSQIAKSNSIAPSEIKVHYEVVVCQRGTLHIDGLLAVVIRLFEIDSLEMRVSDSRRNSEQVDWGKGDIAVLAGGSNVRLSKTGKLICLFFTYKRRNKANDEANDAAHDPNNAGSKITKP